MKKKHTILLCALMLSLSQATWAESSAAQDPYEGYNRFMFRVNDTLDQYVMTPVAKGYRKITPSPVRTGVRNFFNNLRDVVSFGSNLLRLDIEKASTDFVRVGLNSTFGLGGLIDIAGAGQIPDNKNTLGDTFASWGWKNSHYFVYPLTGPSTVRDSIGSTIVYAAPVQNIVFKEQGVRWGAAGLNAIQTREGVLDLTDSLDDAALDKYAYVRDIYMSMRKQQVGATPPGAADGDDIDIDSLVPASSDDDDAPADAKVEAGASPTEDTSAALAATPAGAADGDDIDIHSFVPESSGDNDAPADADVEAGASTEDTPAAPAATPSTRHLGWTEEIIGHSVHAAKGGAR